MITIKTEKGKFFFSSFISLGEEKEAQIDEILLSLFDLKYLITAIETRRVEASEEDLGILKATIIIKEAGTGGENRPRRPPGAALDDGQHLHPHRSCRKH